MLRTMAAQTEFLGKSNFFPLCSASSGHKAARTGRAELSVLALAAVPAACICWKNRDAPPIPAGREDAGNSMATFQALAAQRGSNPGFSGGRKGEQERVLCVLGWGKEGGEAVPAGAASWGSAGGLELLENGTMVPSWMRCPSLGGLWPHPGRTVPGLCWFNTIRGRLPKPRAAPLPSVLCGSPGVFTHPGFPQLCSWLRDGWRSCVLLSLLMTAPPTASKRGECPHFPALFHPAQLSAVCCRA